MLLDDLQQRYGLYVTELVRQALTLEEFHRLEIEELVTYFELKAERTYEEYRRHQKTPHPSESPTGSKDNYLEILHRRWQQSEEMAQTVLSAEKDYYESTARALEA